MATNDKSVWLKTLIGFILTLMVVLATAGAAMISTKVSEKEFNLHEKYQDTQFKDIKASLNRIEDKL
jgi:mannose/fructose/N-acetylgalactosamine-specific phosphotransferase system component IIC